jgi:hypothetical protein
MLLFPIMLEAFRTAFCILSIEALKAGVCWVFSSMNLYAYQSAYSDSRALSQGSGSYSVIFEIILPRALELFKDDVDVLFEIWQVLGLWPDKI